MDDDGDDGIQDDGGNILDSDRKVYSLLGTWLMGASRVDASQIWDGEH